MAPVNYIKDIVFHISSVNEFHTLLDEWWRRFKEVSEIDNFVGKGYEKEVGHEC